MIVRCSQPEVGLLSRRCSEDEFFLQSLGTTTMVNQKDKPVANGVKSLPNGTNCHAELNGVDYHISIPGNIGCVVQNYSQKYIYRSLLTLSPWDIPH